MSRGLGAAALLLLLPEAGGMAQVTGLPVHNSGVRDGWTVGAELGFPSQDYGAGTAYGFRAARGWGRVGISGLVTRYDVEEPFPGQTAVGIAAAASLLPAARALALTLQAGVETFSLDGVRKWHLPIGIGVAVPVAAGNTVLRPWLAPRLDLYRDEFSGSDTEGNFAVSGGLELALPGGLGVGLAYDRIFASRWRPATFGIGVRYHVR